MSFILITVHIIVCLALIMIVLLQTGKGSDMGAAFGGGASQTLFGTTGASSFLSKATTLAAIIFMVTSLILAYVSKNVDRESIIGDTPAPIEQTVTTDGEPPAPADDTTTVPASGTTETDNATPQPANSDGGSANP